MHYPVLDRLSVPACYYCMSSCLSGKVSESGCESCSQRELEPSNVWLGSKWRWRRLPNVKTCSHHLVEAVRKLMSTWGSCAAGMGSSGSAGGCRYPLSTIACSQGSCGKHIERIVKSVSTNYTLECQNAGSQQSPSRRAPCWGESGTCPFIGDNTMAPKRLAKRQWRTACLWTVIWSIMFSSRLLAVAAFHPPDHLYSRWPVFTSRRGRSMSSTTSIEPHAAVALTGSRWVSMIQEDNVKTFEAYEGTLLSLNCGAQFIAIKTARWFSSNNACSTSRDCSEQLKLLCNSRFSCKVVPTSKETTAEASGLSNVYCGAVCSMTLNAQRLLRGEYECTIVEGQSLSEDSLGRHSLGNVVTGKVNYDSIEDAGTAPSSGEIAAAGGIVSFFNKQTSLGLNIGTITDADVGTIREAVDLNKSPVALQGTISTYLQLGSSRSVSRIWFTKGAFATLYLAENDMANSATPAILTVVGAPEYGAMLNPETRGYYWEYADFACGVKDAFAISVGLKPRHTGFASAKIVCTNPTSPSCTNLDVINEAIRTQRPEPVMLQGIACNSKGSAFTLLFADGTVLAFGDPEKGGTMGPAAADALSTFDMNRTQRIKKIVTSQGATAVLLLRGSVYAWGEAQYGGVLPDPEPTGITDIVSNDVGFAALTGEGAVFTWGKGLSIPSRLAGNSVKVTKLYGERTCFAAFDDKGGLYVWGLGSDQSPFCSEGFSSGNKDNTFFEDIRASVSKGMTEVRFSRNAAVAAGKSASERGAWDLIGWGTQNLGGQVPNFVVASARKGVTSLYAGDDAFVLLNDLGNVVAWGDSEAGGEGWDIDVFRGRVSEVIPLSNSFVALSSSGEAYAWGKVGRTIMTSTARNVEGAEQINLQRGLYVLGGSGEGDLFVSVIGYPCIPSSWGEWSACQSLCEGIKKRDRTIELEGKTGKCDIHKSQAAPCQGPKYGTDTCPKTKATAQAEGSEETSASSSGWSVGALAGCGLAGFCIVGISGFMIHTFTRRNN